MFDQNITSVSAAASLPATQPQRQNASDRKSMLYIEDMYDPDKVSDADASKYIVPFEGQLIYDVPNKVIYWAAHVASESARYKTTLEVWQRVGAENDDSTISDILGLPGGFQGDAVLGVDYSVRPPRAVIDGRVWAPNAAYALLYQGDIVGKSGKVISAQYTTGGDVLTQDIPVELAGLDTIQNKTIMVTSPFSVTLNAEELPDGSRATVMFYDSEGNPIRNSQSLSVQHTALLRDNRMGMRYITSVELIAPWFTDATDPKRLNIPVNVAMTSIEFRALIHYSDGDPRVATIDGRKITLIGLNQYKPTSVGSRASLTLVYNLDDDEQMQLSDPGNPNQYRTGYDIVATPVEGAYSPKLYTYPVWEGNGFGLRHYLYDLERSTAIDVTNHVTINESSAVFKPSSYGIEQNMVFNLLLSDVSPQYANWTHVQHTTLVLYGKPGTTGKLWDVRYSYGTAPYAGFNIKGVTANGKQTLTFSGTLANQEAWLTRLYKLVQPMVNPYSESIAPVPNMVDVVDLNGNKWTMAVKDWNKDLVIDKPVAEGQTLILRWIKQSEDGSQKQLAATGVVVSSNPVNDASDSGQPVGATGVIDDGDFTLGTDELISGQSVIATAVVRDTNGNPVSGVAVSFTPSSGYPVTVTSNTAGVATASIDLSVSGTRSIIAATSKGQTRPKTIVVLDPTYTIKAGSLAVDKSQVIAGVGSFTATAKVVDRSGNPVENVKVNFSESGANTNTQVIKTGQDGMVTATFSPNKVGTDILRVAIQTGSNDQTTVTVIDSAYAVLDGDFTLAATTVKKGVVTTASAIVKNASGATVPNVDVTLRIVDGSNYTSKTDANGKAVFSFAIASAGTYSLTANIGNNTTAAKSLTVTN